MRKKTTFPIKKTPDTLFSWYVYDCLHYVQSYMFLISKTSCFSGKIHKILIVVVWVKSWWLFFFMAHTGVVVNSISCPPCLSVLCVYFLTSSRTGWGSDSTFQGFEMVDQSRKRCLFYKEHGQAPHFMCAMTFSFCSSLFCFWLLFLCNSAQMLLCLCVSLAAWIPPPLSLSHSLFILGFTVSIPEGRSIDCNSLSMKSPLCCWRKETPLNGMLTLFLRSFWWLPLLPSIYTVSLTLCFELSDADVREAAQAAGKGQGRVCGDGYTGIITRHHNIPLSDAKETSRRPKRGVVRAEKKEKSKR